MKVATSGYSADDIKAMTQKYLIDTYERFDFIAETAEGMYLYDQNGQAYLDFYGGIAVNSTGNRNEKVVAAAKQQLDDIMHTFNYPYTVPQAVLAKTICEEIGMDKIFFQSTGTEANEAMIKMARKYGVDNYGANRYHIITARQGFHGRTFAAMTATGQPGSAIHKGFGELVPGFHYAQYNNLESFRALVTQDTIAIMVEPVQGEGGVIPATAEFLQGLRKLCDEHKMLLLFDEVQTGWCRTGSIMAYMGYGVKPDIVSMAKAMGGGLPISAICATQKAASAFTPGSHGTTYGGNPVCCAASYAQVRELISGDYAGMARDTGAYFMSQLQKLPCVKEVRGKGLLVGVEFEAPIALAVKHACLDMHLLITAIGDHVIRMVPPLIATKQHCDNACDILQCAIETQLNTKQAG